MIKTRSITVIDDSDWDELVTKTYGRIYSLQQQDGCRDRQMMTIKIPSDDILDDEEMHDEIPENVNDEVMGVKFKKWLERDPKASVNGKTDYNATMWWERNFYPDLDMVANDLFQKGLIAEGEYHIKIDW